MGPGFTLSTSVLCLNPLQNSVEEKSSPPNWAWMRQWKAVAKRHCNVSCLIPLLQILKLAEKFWMITCQAIKNICHNFGNNKIDRHLSKWVMVNLKRNCK